MSDFDDLTARIAAIGRKTIFFVCGSMKSGTTWLQIMLDAHPAISCGGEGHFADRLGPAFQAAANQYNQHIEWKNAQKIGGLEGFVRLGDREMAYTMRAAILLLLAQQAGDKPIAAIGEKTPDNILGLPFLDTLFPEAKFVFLVRDGRDCAVSGWFHNKRLAAEWLDKTYPTLDAYAEATAEGWAKEQLAAVGFARTRKQRCLFIRYEDLLGDAPTILTRVLDFLDVPSDPATVRACCAKGAFATLTGGRAPGTEDPASFFRKGVAEDWRNHLSPQATTAFFKAAGTWLMYFGYPD